MPRHPLRIAIPLVATLLLAAALARPVHAQTGRPFVIPSLPSDSVWPIQGRLDSQMVLLGDTLVVFLGRGTVVNVGPADSVRVDGLMATIRMRRAMGRTDDGPWSGGVRLPEPLILLRDQPVEVSWGILKIVREEGDPPFEPYRFSLALARLGETQLESAVFWSTDRTIGEILAGGGGPDGRRPPE